jgi:membrane protease YdiL (CAAX protease family)
MTPDPTLARTWPAIALAITVAIVYPLLGLRRYRKLERLPDPLPAGLRTKFYRNVILSQWTLVGLAALVLYTGRTGVRGRLAILGQTFGPDLSLTLGVAAMMVAGFAVLSSLTLRQLRRATADQLPAHARRAGRILPRTHSERVWFVGVAFTAGICEEILYRGYLPWFVWGFTGNMTLAFAVATLAFALGHAYQGRGGVIVTGVLGAFLSVVVVLTRSLVPGQILHVIVDLVNGIALGATMARLEATPAPALAPAEPAPAAAASGSDG